jgi:hypothetical protein
MLSSRQQLYISTLRTLKRIVRKHAGHFEPSSFKNKSSLITWRCSHGHKWNASPRNIIKGTWCPLCRREEAGRKRRVGSLAEVRSLAQRNGGRCLSTSYERRHDRLLWRCAKGHKWLATTASVLSGSWCRLCAMKRVQNARRSLIAEMRQLAKAKGGDCLSKTYINSTQKLKWRCAKGHTWPAPAPRIKAGNWCPFCSGRHNININVLQREAKRHNGRLLSSLYRNALLPLQWQCQLGHTFHLSASKVRQGRWCPECSKGLYERICRAYFEHVFNTEFPSTRPPWLRNARGNLMELDGYSSNLKLAFEHNGFQHYRCGNHFMKNKRDLTRRIADDRNKLALCKANGVRLIVIPSLEESLPIAELPGYLAAQFRKLGVRFNKRKLFSDIDLSRVSTPQKLRPLQLLAENKGGKCLTKAYLGARTKHQWKCTEGHVWQASPSHIKRGNWCPKCAGREKSLADMQTLAAKNGGQCRSKRYRGAHINLTWECAQGHRWQAPPTRIQTGAWCRLCGIERSKQKQRGSLADCVRAAKARGGECLSTNYVNQRHKLSWRCCSGHTWRAVAYSVISLGTWCPTCAGKRKTIQDMQTLARANGGWCISKKFNGTKKPLLWKCALNHKWRTNPANVIAGHWCPRCGSNRNNQGPSSLG